MATGIKSKTSDLFTALAGAASLGTQLCTTEKELERYKVYLDSDIAQLALRYVDKPGHTERLRKVRYLALELIALAHESENSED